MTNLFTQFFSYIGFINTPEDNRKIRNDYNKSVTKAYEEFKATLTAIHMNRQSVAESVAQEASEIRLKLKKAAQENNTFLEKVALYARDAWSTASKFFLSKPAKNSEEIAYSSFKTGGGDLGLENNGFEGIEKAWKEIIKNTDYHIERGIYPEAISAEEAKIFNECYADGSSIDQCIGESGITGLYE